MYRVYKSKYLLSVITILLFFLIVSSGICQKAEYTFDLATADPTWGGVGVSLLLYASSVRYLSGGKVDINIYPGGEWGGSPGDNIKSIELGELDMAGVNATPLAQLKGSEALEVFNMPFIFKSPIDEISFVFESAQKYTPIAEKIIEQVDKNSDYIVLMLGPLGRRDVLASKPVKSLEDLKGLKIRTMESSMQVDAFNFLGAIASPLPYAECYTALQLGTIDAMENSPDIYVQNRYYEVAPYWLGTAHYTVVAAIVMSKKAWNSLPVSYQNILKSAGIGTGYILSQWGYGASEAVMKGELEKFAKSVVHFTQEESNELRKMVLPKLLDKYSKKIGMEIIEELAKEDDIIRDWYGKNK